MFKVSGAVRAFDRVKGDIKVHGDAFAAVLQTLGSKMIEQGSQLSAVAIEELKKSFSDSTTKWVNVVSQIFGTFFSVLEITIGLFFVLMARIVFLIEFAIVTLVSVYSHRYFSGYSTIWGYFSILIGLFVFALISFAHFKRIFMGKDHVRLPRAKNNPLKIKVEEQINEETASEEKETTNKPEKFFEEEDILSKREVKDDTDEKDSASVFGEEEYTPTFIPDIKEEIETPVQIKDIPKTIVDATENLTIEKVKNKTKIVVKEEKTDFGETTLLPVNPSLINIYIPFPDKKPEITSYKSGKVTISGIVSNTSFLGFKNGEQIFKLDKFMPKKEITCKIKYSCSLNVSDISDIKWLSGDCYLVINEKGMGKLVLAVNGVKAILLDGVECI